VFHCRHPGGLRAQARRGRPPGCEGDGHGCPTRRRTDSRRPGRAPRVRGAARGALRSPYPDGGVVTERLQAQLRKRGLDGFVATSFQGVYYTSGIRSATLRIFPRDAQVYAVVRTDDISRPVIVAGRGDMDTVAASGERFRGVGYGKFFRSVDFDAKLTDVESRLVSWGIEKEPAASAGDALAEALSALELGAASVGFEELNGGVQETVRRALPAVELVAAPEALKEARLVKTAIE